MSYQSPGVPPQPVLVPTYSYAHWGQRVGATLLDGIFSVLAEIPAAIGVLLIAVGSDTTTHVDANGRTVVDDWSLDGVAYVGIALTVVGLIFAIGFGLWNIVFRQGRTGASLGKSALGLRLVRETTGQSVGAGTAFLRQLLHILDGAVCYLGYLWPLWDEKRQTFADKIVGSVVINGK